LIGFGNGYFDVQMNSSTRALAAFYDQALKQSNAPFDWSGYEQAIAS
jgi:hypothetical protein